MNKTKLLALLLVLVLVISVMASCGGKKPDTDPDDENQGEGGNNNEGGNGNQGGNGGNQGGVVYEDIDLNDVVTRTDYTSVYEVIGSQITIDMVREEDGLAYVDYEGVTYELGMDFLSMAMVYNTKVPEGSPKYATEEDVYNEWFKLYTLRWNYLVAEVPLYSNEYYDLYNSKLENFVTTPYFGAADAIVAATVKEGYDNSVILGSATDLSGAFRNASWGKSNPGAADNDIQNLTTGYSTMMTNPAGNYVNNYEVLADVPVKVDNEDGSATYTITIKQGLKFSDGTDITAKNYIAGVLVNSSPVAVAAGGTGTSGLTLVGYDAFSAYDGTNADEEGVSAYFEGVKLINDYTFAVTIDAEYASYYYSYTYAGFSPDPLQLYLGSTGEIVVDPETGACGLNAAFYEKTEKDGAQVYARAAEIVANLKWNSGLPYSGPYVVSNYNEATLTATLSLNPQYTGDLRGNASIATITYIKVETETQMDKFTQGEVDVIAGITGGTETVAALTLVRENPDKYAETHYARAGYGKMGFRGDFGPTSDIAVRQAIMYTLNRNEFAQAFTGGYGSVVHGAYYEGFDAYKANKQALEEGLNTYAFSIDDAIDVLEEAGWIYNGEGKEFNAETDAVRYKKLSGYELTKANLEFKSTDSKYKTVKIAGEYYMPLVINWYGTQPNDVTDLLIAQWQTSSAPKQVGMYITYTSCDFTSGLYGEYLQITEFGFDGVPKLGCINFATSFNSALYDFAFGWTLDQSMYADMSAYYIMDEADFYANYTQAD